MLNDFFDKANAIDYYGKLLTNNQLEIAKSYYYDNLSLSEIAENNNISRAAVHDTIKRVDTLLEEYENKLSLIATDKKRSSIIDEINKLNDNKKIKELLEKLNSL